MKTIICVILALALASSYLITPEKVRQSFAKYGQDASGNVNQGFDISKTTCNTVDPSAILPEGVKASDFVVRSGYNLMGKQNSAFGFIFWGAQAAQGNASLLKNYPTLIWLQGGPGGSSQFGDFVEMGPIQVRGFNGKYTTYYNKDSWNQKYNIIFIDNPIGTGISHAASILDIPKNQQEVAEQFYNGLIELYTADNGCFNLLDLQDSPLFITGESYAGKYVPSIGDYILNQDATSVVRKALEKGGLAVGDGFTDPETIMNTYPGFGYSLSLVNQQERQKAENLAKKGTEEINNEQFLQAQTTFDLVLNEIMNAAGISNSYDWADTSNGPDTPLDLTGWFNQTSIKTGVFQFPAALNYNAQSNAVYFSLSSDFMKTNVVGTVKDILNKDFPVLYYNGQNDIIVCTPCTENWLDQVSYPGQQAFASADFGYWFTPNGDEKQLTGYYKQSKNLAFVTVNQAGHMVPTFQPASSLHMIESFVDFAQSYHKNSAAFESSQFDMFNLPEEKHEQKYEILYQ